MKCNYENNSDLTLQKNIETNSIESESSEPENSILLPPLPGICPTTGELVENGGFEEFKCELPKGWKTPTPCSVTRVTEPGHVHSGNSCVGLSNCTILTQKITSGIYPHCYYEFSFFAQDEGTQGSCTATVTFIKGGEEYPGGEIKIRSGDIPNCPRQFGYYSTITCKAPNYVTGVKIEFVVITRGCHKVNIDDVSFAAQ